MSDTQVTIPREVCTRAMECAVIALRMTDAERSQWYVEHVGYDPVAEDPADLPKMPSFVAGMMLFQGSSEAVAAGRVSEREVETAERLLGLYLDGADYALCMLANAWHSPVTVERAGVPA